MKGLVRTNLLGRRFGRLEVLSLDETRGQNKVWLCRCACGVEKRAYAANLTSGATRSCGCFRSEKASRMHWRHGDKRSAEYRAWSNMKQRCYVPTTKMYHRYGGRGITVCERWRGDYCAFLADMGRRPSADHSIDRIDTDGNYEPSNCKWATRAEQARNRTNNRYVAINGVAVIQSDAAKILGLSISGLRYRVAKGMLEEALV